MTTVHWPLFTRWAGRGSLAWVPCPWRECPLPRAAPSTVSSTSPSTAWPGSHLRPRTPPGPTPSPGQRLSTRLKPTSLSPDGCPDAPSILSPLDSTGVIDANEGDMRPCWAHSASPDPSWEQTKGPGRAVLSGSPGHPRPTPLSLALPQSPLPTRLWGGPDPTVVTRASRTAKRPPQPLPSGFPRPFDQEGEEVGPLGGGPQVLRARRLQRGPGDPSRLLDFTSTPSCHSSTLLHHTGKRRGLSLGASCPSATASCSAGGVAGGQHQPRGDAGQPRGRHRRPRACSPLSELPN